MFEMIFMIAIILGWFAIAGLLEILGLGALLLIDYVFKTHVGRRVCRWIFYEN